MKKKETPSGGDREPKRLPRKHLPGYVFIPKDGYYQIRKVGLNADRVNTDPNYYYTRLLAAQFAKTARLTKLLLDACSKPLGIKCKANDLTRIIIRALEADTASFLGKRRLLCENLEELHGFEFNEQAHFEETCTLPFSIKLRARAGGMNIEIPSFVPEYYLKAPAGVTHARIWLISVLIDPREFTGTAVTAKTTCFPLKRVHVMANSLAIPPKPKASFVQVSALGIQWYGYTNGQRRLKPSVAPGAAKIINIR